MIRSTLEGDECIGKLSNFPGPCEDTLLKQRRAAAFYKNNPDEILSDKFNTFTGVPLGGPIDYSMPGYEDAPGTDFRTDDVDLCKLRKQMEDTRVKTFEENFGELKKVKPNPMEPMEKVDKMIKENFDGKSIGISFGVLLVIFLIVAFIIYLIVKKT